MGGITFTFNPGPIDDLIQKQMPFAVSKALNQTAFAVRNELIRQAKAQLEEPTQFTLRGFLVKKATKQDLVAQIFINPVQDAYMKFLIQGGTRKTSQSKRRLIVPTPALRLDRFGNIPRRHQGAIKQMLADKAKFFSGVPKGHHGAGPGVWKRLGKGGRKNLKRVIAYIDRAHYVKQFDFYEICKRESEKRFQGYFDEALKQAMQTANP